MESPFIPVKNDLQLHFISGGICCTSSNRRMWCFSKRSSAIHSASFISSRLNWSYESYEKSRFSEVLSSFKTKNFMPSNHSSECANNKALYVSGEVKNSEKKVSTSTGPLLWVALSLYCPVKVSGNKCSACICITFNKVINKQIINNKQINN